MKLTIRSTAFLISGVLWLAPFGAAQTAQDKPSETLAESLAGLRIENAERVLAGMEAAQSAAATELERSLATERLGVAGFGRIERASESPAKARNNPVRAAAGPSPSPRETTRLTPQIPSKVPVSLPAVAQSTLFTGGELLEFVVPEKATKLEFTFTSARSADVRLYARYGMDVDLVNGKVVADHFPETGVAPGKLVITLSSKSPLKPGSYFVAIALLTTATAVDGVVTAAVDCETVQPPREFLDGTELKWGEQTRIALPAVNQPAVFLGKGGFWVNVPNSADRLEVTLATSAQNTEIILLARYGSDVVIENNRFVFDHIAAGESGVHKLAVTTRSSPPLKPGIYFIAVVVLSLNQPIDGTFTAEDYPRDCQFGLPGVANPTLFNGGFGCQFKVPAGARELRIRMNSASPSAHVALHVKNQQDAVVRNGEVVADYSMTGTGSEKTMVLGMESNPRLQGGVYYVAFGLMSKGTTARGTVNFSLVSDSTTPVTPATPTSAGGPDCTGNKKVEGTIPALDTTTLLADDDWWLDVPACAQRLEFRVETTARGAEVGIFARKGRQLDLVGGRVQADYASPGFSASEVITVTSSSRVPLSAGRHYFGIGVLTLRTPLPVRITATYEGAAVR